MKEYTIKINGNDYIVSVKSVENNIAKVTVNGTEYQVEVEGMAVKAQTPKVSQPATPSIPVASQSAGTAKPGDTASAVAGDIKAPLPGVILDVMVREGDAVKPGQRLMVLEAMKMENNIDSDRDGVVRKIVARKGDSVLEGDVLITIG